MPRFWDYLSDADKAKLKARWPKIRPPKSDGVGVFVDAELEDPEEMTRKPKGKRAILGER